MTAGHHFGADGYASTGLSDNIGSFSGSPPATAGDILLVVVAAVGGSSASDPVLSDNLGSSGWVKQADVLGNDGVSGLYHGTYWTKICAGGETTVGVAPAGGTATDMAFVGYWLTAPSFPFPYVIDQGYAVFQPGGSPGQLWTDTIAPSGNNQTYVGMSAQGRATPTSILMPGATSGTAELLIGSVTAATLCNDAESGNSTSDRPTYSDARNDVDEHMYVVLFGIQSAPPASELAGDAGIIDATGELSATPGIALLAGDSSPISGEADLTTTGGELVLGGRSSPISASGRLRAILPFPQPVRPIEVQLGCGIYQAMAMTRGLGEIVGMLPFTTIQWGRQLDATSTAELTMDGIANPRAFARCCGTLSQLNPEEHELAIIRNGWRVWSGPMTDITFPNEQCVIDASDLSWWLTQRSIHNTINSVAQDLVNVWVAYVQDAMSVENSAGLYPTVLALTGQLIDRLVQEQDHQLASDAIAELQRTGLDWTTIDRIMQGGPLQPQPPPFPGATPYPTVIDASFRTQPTILISGSQGANCWYVNGPADGAGDLIFGEYGPAFPSTPDHVAQPAAPDYAAIEEQYGRIEKIVTESRILDQDSIDFNAETRYDLFKRPAAIISDGALLPSCPIPMSKLVPGSLYNVHLSNACRPVGDVYRLQTLAVTANNDGSEDVNVTWQPQGTGQTL